MSGHHVALLAVACLVAGYLVGRERPTDPLDSLPEDEEPPSERCCP